MTLRHALAHSVNTVAVALQQDIGTKRVAAMARRLGIASTLREDASLALGTSEVTLLELAGAYGVLARDGQSVSPHVINRVRTDRGTVLHARPASRPATVVGESHVGRINDMLHAALVAGTGRRAALPQHVAAGKTGTTQDYRDAWFVGFTAHLTAGVWVGNDDGAPMDGISGSGLPALIWRDVMKEAHRALTPAPLPGVVVRPSLPAPSTAPRDAIARPLAIPRRPPVSNEQPQPRSPLSPIDPPLFAAPRAPTPPAYDTRRLEALLARPPS